MYKLTLLLIPLILLSSCTIDWNDEKDAKIAELESINSDLRNQRDTYENELEEKNEEIEEKDGQINTYDDALEDCNSTISTAKNYAGETYEDMNDALENLQECDI